MTDLSHILEETAKYSLKFLQLHGANIYKYIGIKNSQLRSKTTTIGKSQKRLLVAKNYHTQWGPPMGGHFDILHKNRYLFYLLTNFKQF